VGHRYLARKDKGQLAGIFGAGVQAKMQLWAIAEARELSKAFVYDLSEEAVKKFNLRDGRQTEAGDSSRHQGLMKS